MKLKVQPDDFQVEELMRLDLRPQGKFLVYRLEKRLWNTLDVLDFVARKYRLRGLGRAGLKDRYSHSVQFISAKGEGPKLIEEKSFTLRLVGRSNRPVARDSMTGNRFRIVLRDLSEDELTAVKRNLSLVAKHGFPNYFDEQRFGSARHGEGFIAQKLILGHCNGALKLYMATPSAFDDARTRRVKSFLRDNWGNWSDCLQHALPEFRPVLHYLSERPQDFEGAVREIRRDLLEIFLNAFQSHLWNETLRLLIMSFGLKTVVVAQTTGELLFYQELNPKAREFFDKHRIPVASPLAQAASERVGRALNAALTQEGLTLRDMKLRLRIQGLYFKPFDRAGVVFADKLKVSKPEPDELYPGRRKLTLSFELPPGSYATILVKRLALSGQ